MPTWQLRSASSGMDPIWRGLRLLRTFEGRDTRAQFWPYCGVVLGGWFVVANVATVAAFIATAGSSRVRGVVAVFVVLTIIAVAMLASAVARRLHDRGRRGAWALVPLVLLATGLGLFAAMTDGGAGPGLFLAGFGVNLLYFAVLATLVVQLVLPSRATT